VICSRVPSAHSTSTAHSSPSASVTWKMGFSVIVAIPTFIGTFRGVGKDRSGAVVKRPCAVASPWTRSRSSAATPTDRDEVGAIPLTDCKKFRPLTYGFGQCQIGALHPRAGVMNFSTADWTMLRIRCCKCGQHTEKIVTVLVRKDAISCVNCGARISLSTPTNKILIAETAASCDRVGAAMIKALALADPPSPRN